MDRGWRRSGTLLYKPDNLRSCCPHWTIRLRASSFKPSRGQRKVLNRFNRYVLGQDYAKETARLRPRSKEEKARCRNEFNLLDSVHEAESNRIPNMPPRPAHDFEVVLEPDNFSEDKYKVFEKYQSIIHNEPPPETTRHSFKRFLCSSPLRRTAQSRYDGENSIPVGDDQQDPKHPSLGSFHQVYRIDGKIIAVAVLDLLPHAVSSVYLFYDPDFQKHDLGKVSALREAAMALESGFDYYYMGFYIHSCDKMRYKAELKPQLVLDLDLDNDPTTSDLKDLEDADDGTRVLEEGKGTWRLLDSPEVQQCLDDNKGTLQPGRRPQIEFPNPTSASESNLSLFALHVPGTLSPETVDRMDLNSFPVMIGKQDGALIVEAQVSRAIWSSLPFSVALFLEDLSSGACFD